MLALEQYLLQQGYEKYKKVFNKKTKEYSTVKEKEGYHFISSMVNIFYLYRKENAKDIYVGLNEYPKPPTLIYPRPIVKMDGNIVYCDDDFINRILAKYSNEEMLSIIQNGTVVELN